MRMHDQYAVPVFRFGNHVKRAVAALSGITGGFRGQTGRAGCISLGLRVKREQHSAEKPDSEQSF